MQSGADGNTTRLYVPFLHEKGIISEPTFSFYLSNLESYLDVGEPDTSVMRYDEDGDPEIAWLSVIEDDPNWSNHITGFYWGDVLTPTLYSLPKRKAMISTGSSCVQGPREFMNEIIESLVSMLTSS